MSNENEQFELEEQMRRAGIEAYADGIAEMLSQVGAKNGREMDEAQLEMIKQGIADTLAPRRSRPAQYAMPPQPKCSRFYDHEESGRITVFDWISLCDKSTHFDKSECAGIVDIRFWTNCDLVMELHGAPAVAFWDWQEEQRALSTWRPAEEIG